MKLEGKVAIITGGTDGIGKAIAVTLAKEGVRIMMGARNEAKGRTAIGEVRRFREATYLKVNVSDSSQVRRMVEETEQRYGRIDILVNNAARQPITQIHPLRRTGSPQEIALAALFLATGDSSFVTGAAIPVDGGLLAGWT